MDSVKTIRAVERAFEVLRALQGMPQGAVLVELHQTTGLSGPTLLRLLKTLMAAGVVRRSLTDQRYRNTVHLEVLAHGIGAQDRLADVATPWLDWLCQQVEWPSDFLVHTGDDDYMRVVESNLRQSRFFVRRRPEKSRVNLLGSAAGLAFLSALTRRRRLALVQACRTGGDLHNTKVIAVHDLDERLAQARQLGYALRHPLYRGGGYQQAARDDRLQALAVPVLGRGAVIGALNINWNRAAFTAEEMARKHLPALNQAARGIARAAQEAGVLTDWPGLERLARGPVAVTRR